MKTLIFIVALALNFMASYSPPTPIEFEIPYNENMAVWFKDLTIKELKSVMKSLIDIEKQPDWIKEYLEGR